MRVLTRRMKTTDKIAQKHRFEVWSLEENQNLSSQVPKKRHLLRKFNSYNAEID